MKRFLGISFFILLIAPYLCILSWYIGESVQLKEEVRKKLVAGINKEELLLLKISYKHSNHLTWEDDNEFEYKGEMYDVINSITTKDSIYYFCWNDNKETLLHKKVDLLLSKLIEGSQKNAKSKSLIVFFKSLFYNDEIESYGVRLLCNTIAYNFEEPHYFSPIITTIGPPPKSVLTYYWIVM